jgi:uncharacterized protein (TIGR02246 family)
MQSQDRSALEALCATFTAAWNRHDAKGMAATYAESGSLADPFGGYSTDRAAIEQRFAGLHDGPARNSTTQVTLRSFEPVTADLALVDLDQVAHGMLDPTGATIPEARFLARGVAEKRDGNWALRFMGVILLVA